MHEGYTDVLSEHKSICLALNLDKSTADEAWKNYFLVKKSISLDGDQRPWLGCAIYVAARSARLQTVGRPSVSIEGNLVSLAGLLRHCELSVLDFFKKCKKWMDWSDTNPKMKARLDHLERKFTVSMVVFLKYRPIFIDMFKEPIETSPPSKSKKQRSNSLTITKLFDFCWTLFLCLKSRVPIVAEDLVNSMHLLLATCDLVYANVLMTDRKDLLNPDFLGLPKDFMDGTLEKPPCIVDILCRRHNGLPLEAQFAKTYCLRPSIIAMIRSGALLSGQKSSPEALLSANVFDANLKGADNAYQDYVFSVGDFDERIFLSEDASDDIGTRARIPDAREDSSDLNIRRDPSTHNVLITPLTGRGFLKDKDKDKCQTPLSSVTAAVRNLMTLIAGRSVGKPSDALLQKFKSLSPKLDKEISERLGQMGELFMQASMVGQVPGHDATAFVRRRLEYATTLYYRVLEKIIAREMAPSLKELLNQDLIHRSLFACCLEIVMFSYNTQRPFPWVEDVLGVDPFHFYRIIEITLRADDAFSSNVVKYLQTLEERVLEMYAWRSSSPLWEQIKELAYPVPKCNEVSFSSQLLNEEEMTEDAPQSTQGAQLVDRFSSPVKSVRPGQSVLANNYKGPNKPDGQENAEIVRPIRTGSMALFFRKFYFLSNMRMQDICTRLSIHDLALRRKIWTCFEYSIVQHTDLMRDRHVDQILMCAVYVMCRVLHTPEQPTRTDFTDILRVYRNQPQATSAVYRNVLLEPKNEVENRENQAGGEKRGNIIQFYNAVYMFIIQAHAREYVSTEPRDRTKAQPLSPLPRIRHPAPSPVKSAPTTPHSRVFMTSMNMTNNTSFDDITGNTILIHSSPAKDLEKINEKISQSLPRVPVKRILGDSDGGPPMKKSSHIYMKLASVVNDRSKQ